MDRQTVDGLIKLEKYPDTTPTAESGATRHRAARRPRTGNLVAGQTSATINPPVTYASSAADSVHEIRKRIERGGFYIYHWPKPEPTNFPFISERYRAWKEQTDAEEAKNYSADSEVADDWHDFLGTRDSYGPVPGSFERCIAREFVTRAKCAYRNGETWVQFEDRERSIDSLGWAKDIEDPERRKLELELSLDNEFRLKVFSAMYHRLRTEIWLEEDPVD